MNQQFGAQRMTNTPLDSRVSAVDYEAVFAAMSEAVCVLDEQGHIQYINESASRTLGYERDDLLGFAFHAVLYARRPDGSLLPVSKSPILKVMRSGKRSEASLDYFRRKDGGFVRVSFSSSPLISDGATRGVVLNFRDVTAQFKHDEKRNAFVAILAHDLKTPLHSASRVIEMVLKGRLGGLNEEQRTCLTHLHQANSDVLGVVETALDVFRAVRGTADSTGSMVDLAPLIRLCEFKLRREAEERCIDLRLDVPQVECIVPADEVGLQHVLMNLMGNAIKFTHPGGKVSVRAEVDGNDVIITVSDSGVGLSEEEIAMMFQPFWQGALGRKQFCGSGLGLFLCRQIVESFGGTILMRSQVDIGTDVTVRLPLKVETVASF